MDSSKQDLPGGEPGDDEQQAGNGTRRRWPLAAAVIIVALVAVAGGVAVAGNIRRPGPCWGLDGGSVHAGRIRYRHDGTVAHRDGIGGRDAVGNDSACQDGTFRRIMADLYHLGRKNQLRPPGVLEGFEPSERVHGRGFRLGRS